MVFIKRVGISKYYIYYTLFLFSDFKPVKNKSYTNLISIQEKNVFSFTRFTRFFFW